MVYMDREEALLGKRRWDNRCLRSNVAQPEFVVQVGTVKVAKIRSNVLNKEKEPELYEAIKAIAPEWWGDETHITLNKNVTCKRHRDYRNEGSSWILFLGNFTGGALVFDDGARVEGKGVWHKIDGHKYHWNEPHEGTKYSIVLYRRTGPMRDTSLNKAWRAKHATPEAKTETNATSQPEAETDTNATA